MRYRSRVVQEDGLADLERAAKAHAATRDRLRREILFASLAGTSLRAIATLVAMSPESVRTIVREENAKRDRVIARLERPWAALSVGGHERNLATRRGLARKWRLSVQESDN